MRAFFVSEAPGDYGFLGVLWWVFALWIVIEGSEKPKSSRDSGSKDRLVLILGGVHGQCNAARFFLFR
jgi:hypothetical protein